MSEDELREIEERYGKSEKWDLLSDTGKLYVDAYHGERARTDIPALVAEVRRLRGIVGQARDLMHVDLSRLPSCALWQRVEALLDTGEVPLVDEHGQPYPEEISNHARLCRELKRCRELLHERCNERDELRSENERLRAENERLNKLQWDTETERLQQTANRDLWKERFEYLRGQVHAFLSYDLDDPETRRRSIDELKVIL